MNYKYKLQILDSMVYTKSSLTFLFQKKRKERKRKKSRKRERKTKKRKTKKIKKEKRKTPLRDCLLLSYQKKKNKWIKKSSLKRFLSTNFSFWFVRRPQICVIICHDPRDKVKNESRNFSSVIGFFVDGQQKSQYFWFYRQNNSLFRNTFQWKLVSYGNQSIDLLCKSNDWFLYDTSFY